jgi:hypothetical protein
MGKSKEAGESAVVQFHNQFNAGHYKQIYDQADEAFRKAATEQRCLLYLRPFARSWALSNSRTQRVPFAAPLNAIVLRLSVLSNGLDNETGYSSRPFESLARPAG